MSSGHWSGSHVGVADGIASLGPWGEADGLVCAAKHLAMAASELARDGKATPGLVAKLSAAEAQFRCVSWALEGVLPAGKRGAPASPVVPIDDRHSITLVELLASIYRRERWWVTNCSVDPELVAGARDLLRSLRWELPAKGTSNVA